ncbi:MAG: hypothetical protein FWG79_08695 [Bacteroidales bacterium]|nr:hypothetical protein [Bacteroidales bacterium]
MKRKSYLADDSSLDVNVASEPAVAYSTNREHTYQYDSDKVTYAPQPILEPDEKLRNAISVDEFKEIAREIVGKVHYNFYGNERLVDPRNT